MSVMIFIFQNFIVGASSFILAFKLLRLKSITDRLLVLFIFYFAQIVLTQLTLGIMGALYLKNLILLNLIVFSVLWNLSRKNIGAASAGYLRDDASLLLNSKLIIFVFSVVLGFGLVKVLINLVNPPFGWDDINYHFTFPVEWLKHANLENPITVFDDPSPTYYPINGSLFFFWLMLPFRNVFIADLGQVPFFILGFLAVYSLGKKLGLKIEHAFIAACLFSLIPNYFKQLEIAYVDVMVGALFLAGLNFLFLLKEEFSLENIVIYSLTLGLLLGVKTVALPYSLLLFVPFIYQCVRNIDRPYALFLSVIIVLLFGGFSYIRNLLETGNPLYPLDFKLFGKTIFKGVMDHATYRAHFTLKDYDLAKILFHEGMGIQSLIFVLPAIFLALPLTLIKRRKGADFCFFYLLILPLLFYCVYRYLIPLANTRYLYGLLGMGAILGFYCMEILKVPRRAISVIVIICCLASISELSKRTELVFSILISVSLFFLLVFFTRFSGKKITIRKPVLGVCFAAIFVLLGVLEKDYNNNEFVRYLKTIEYSGFWPDAVKAWEWLNNNTSGNNIAYAGRPVPFPLYGSNFKNNVYYVSVNKTEPVKLHSFKNSYYQWGKDFLELHKNLEARDNYRYQAEYPVWLNNLLHRNTDYLFIYSLHQTKEILFPLEDEWAKKDAGEFLPAYTNTAVRIYKILK